VLTPAGAVGSPPAFGTAGRWITYPDGRVFLPHGLNAVVTAPPYHARLGVADARLLASEGFTALRLALLPAGLEAQLGHVDRSYPQRVAAQARLLSRYGISTLVALNQDGYSEACGGDGFPGWAVLAPCDAGVDMAWAAFWADAEAADGVGLQEHYLAWWRAAAPLLRGTPGLLGLDLLNEPDSTQPAVLGRLASRAAAITGGLAFAEPGDPGAPDFGGALAQDIGYAGHVYCQTTLQLELAGATPSAGQVASCIRSDRAMLATQVAFARREARPLLVGEFGGSDELVEQRALVDAMGGSLVPWLGYAYTARGDTSGAPPQSLLRDESAPPSQENAKQAKLDALVVPYPLATAGTPLSWRFDRVRSTVRFVYATRRADGRGRYSGSQPTVVFVPRRVYPHGYRATATGGRIVSRPTAPWLEVAAKPGAERVTVTLAPRTGSTTLTPLQVDRCGYDLGRCG
jgi:endoglycosylceramidase